MGILDKLKKKPRNNEEYISMVNKQQDERKARLIRDQNAAGAPEQTPVAKVENSLERAKFVRISPVENVKRKISEVKTEYAVRKEAKTLENFKKHADSTDANISDRARQRLEAEHRVYGRTLTTEERAQVADFRTKEKEKYAARRANAKQVLHNLGDELMQSPAAGGSGNPATKTQRTTTAERAGQSSVVNKIPHSKLANEDFTRPRTLREQANLSRDASEEGRIFTKERESVDPAGIFSLNYRKDKKTEPIGGSVSLGDMSFGNSNIFALKTRPTDEAFGSAFGWGKPKKNKKSNLYY